MIHLAFLATARNRVSAIVTWLFALARGARRERATLVGNPVMAPQPYQEELTDHDECSSWATASAC